MQSLYTDMTYSFLIKLMDASLIVDKERITELGLTTDQVKVITALPHSDLYKLSRIYRLIDISVNELALTKAISLAKDNVRCRNDIENMDVTHKLLRNLSTLSAHETESKSLSQLFNLSNKIISQLASMTIQDTLAIARTGIVFYDITANEVKLAMALEYIQEARREEEAISHLIVNDASWPMVNALTGMSRALFQEMRKSLNAPKTLGGPPRRLTEEEEILAWNSWASTAEKTPLERCIAVSQTLNTIALRHLWPTLSEWMKEENASERNSVHV
ncbi:STY4526/YPO1902 family pathogenicity island replication protein [Methylophaga thalassica]|uniref:STY4526/YPO1902 family pathogenicity island replication protein n=1 Tax=Methylophaga thalassica TaxID=40223 RepID=UPI002E7BF9C2|nr:STY4526/YPO1902 family pathogenicity island replication protein [Methylophaga thalassica]WVI83890.1 STY4526/YPO1902 family pathogenicity island replication protein [Methylophaga thalassica]